MRGGRSLTFEEVQRKYLKKGVKSSKGKPIHGKQIKRFIYAHSQEFKALGLDIHRCDGCFRTDTSWDSPRYGNVFKMELHHKNGDWNDNRMTNFEVLCPICHSMTPNYKRRKS